MICGGLVFISHILNRLLGVTKRSWKYSINIIGEINLATLKKSMLFVAVKKRLAKASESVAIKLLGTHFFKLSRISLSNIMSSGVGGAGGASIVRTLLTTLTI